MKCIFCILMLAARAVAVQASDEPFRVSAKLGRSDGDTASVVVQLSMDEGHYVYAESLEVSATDGVTLFPKSIPAPKQKHDAFLEKTVEIFEGEVVFSYTVEGGDARPFELRVSYQGCSQTLCFPPATKNFALGTKDAAALPVASQQVAAALPPSELADRMASFTLVGKAAGYLKADAFVAFLDDAEQGGSAEEDWLAAMVGRKGPWVWMAVLLIVVFGAGLNLTPCVLPMIPVNVAIIGAGAAAGSRGRGAALGGIYGAAIAIVYGILGLLVVLTGSRFGTLNASPVFNVAIAVVFVVLALAMFDVITIDLSRFQGRAGTGSSGKGSFVLAFFMGGVAALLAGACVAPVLISVLLLSADLYTRGAGGALMLPFLLGLGMGLPWPFLGAGLSFLPKPGRWMQRVKIVFGILILGFALYYGRLAYRLYAADGTPAQELVAEEASGEWLTSLSQAMTVAKTEKRPVFIDFWASWCKNCLVMDKTTFKNPEVVNRLASYVKVKHQAEDLKDPETKAVLDMFGVIGLPTYIVLAPE